MIARTAAIMISSSLAGACAIHPVPEDFARVDTYHIVRQIRCETRESVKAVILDRLDALARHGDPIAQQILTEQKRNVHYINEFDPRVFRGPEYVRVRQLFELIFGAGIAYNFDLTMTEDNDVTADLGLLQPLTAAKLALGLNAGSKRRRTNERTFTITDSFGFLLHNLNNEVRGVRYCDNQIAGENYAYPVAGRIGVDKTVESFLQLVVFANLAGDKAAPGIPGTPPTMADKLTFTTTINLTATPKIEFTPVGSAFQVANATLTAGVVRSDKHDVTVGLALPGAFMAELAPFRSYLFSPGRGGSAATSAVGKSRVSQASSLYVGSRVTGGGTPAEQLAVIAVDQLKSRELQLIPPQ